MRVVLKGGAVTGQGDDNLPFSPAATRWSISSPAACRICAPWPRGTPPRRDEAPHAASSPSSTGLARRRSPVWTCVCHRCVSGHVHERHEGVPRRTIHRPARCLMTGSWFKPLVCRFPARNRSKHERGLQEVQTKILIEPTNECPHVMVHGWCSLGGGCVPPHRKYVIPAQRPPKAKFITGRFQVQFGYIINK